MKSAVKKLVSVAVCALLSCAFIVIMFFCAPEIAVIPEASGTIEYDTDSADSETATAEVGEDVTAVRINELKELGRITKVNYVPDRFVYPRRLTSEIQIVDLTKSFEFAEKGTLIFIVLNLDPHSENFNEQVADLSPFKVGDYWKCTFSLPKVFCASNVYLGTELVACSGEIENYSFINYTTTQDKTTEKLISQTSSVDMNFRFYTRRQTMERTLSSASVVTVHYQSSGTAFSGVDECPLIGGEDAVTGVRNNSRDMLLGFSILALVMFAIYAVLSFLKRTAAYVPETVWTFAIFIMLLSRFSVASVTGAPLLWIAVSFFAPFAVLSGALMSFDGKLGRLSLKRVFPLPALAGGILAFIRPFVPFGVSAELNIVCAVIKGVCALALCALVVRAVFRKDGGNGTVQLVCLTLIAVAEFASLFLPQVFPAKFNPMFWACGATAFLTLVSVLKLYKETERANEYLTDNMQLEIERQTKDIKAVIAERDNLLQFVSHDMKKPLVSSSALLDTLIDRESDGGQVKALKIVRQNTARVVSNLSEIGAYAKFNYIAEPSQSVDLSKLCGEVCEFHYPDCNANGIILKNLVDGHRMVYVKKSGLENAVSNIILNAVEHANCSSITLSVKSDRKRTHLLISDDGDGIASDADILNAYVSADKRETGGLGLYICKNIIESMNGELSYTSRQGNTVFCISLLKA